MNFRREQNAFPPQTVGRDSRLTSEQFELFGRGQTEKIVWNFRIEA